MNGYFVFLKKELFEAYKTHKLLIMCTVMLIFGATSPFITKLMPDIMKWTMESEPSTSGIDLSAMFADPTALDSWAMFYSNVGQMGLIALVIVFGGIISSEITKGTLSIILTKGLTRPAAVLSKFTAALLVWTGSLTVSFLAAWACTVYLFPDSPPYVVLAVFCLWLFGVFLLSLTILFSALVKKSFVCVLLVGAAGIALNIINIIPGVSKYNPISLFSYPISLLQGVIIKNEVYPALIVSVIFIGALVLLAVMAFCKVKSRKKTAALILSVFFCLFLTVFIGEETPAKIKLNKSVISEKITVGAGTEWELAGLLTLPKNAQGTVPAVVLVHGSGGSDMDETIYANKPFKEIAEHLSSNGIAVIRYNKRTYTYGAKMAQDLGNLTVWDETIEDALLATEILKSDPRIDADKIFILGHSLGGMLAPRIHASGGDYAGLILLAGSPRQLIDIMKDQNQSAINELEDEEEKITAMEEQILFYDEFEKGLILSEDEAKNTVLMGVSMYYFKDLHENPTRDYLEEVTVPILVMHAADDLQVYTDKDFGLYKELLGDRDNVTFIIYDGLNHLFMPATTSKITELLDEYKIKSHIDYQVLTDIEEWINAIT